MTGPNGSRRRIQARSEELFRALREHLAQRRPLAVVKAPPGSGKTHLLLRLTAHAFSLENRVAVGTQTNSQADDVCQRLAREYPHVPVYRFAARAAEPIDLGRSVQYARSEDELPLDPCVVVGTVAKWSLVEVSMPFDVLLIDEAWQMAWGDFMLCGQVAGRFVLIGDPGQIPPVVAIPVERWETSPRAPHLPAPDLILADPSLEFLSEDIPASRRLPADAVDLIRRFYDFPFEAWAQGGERFVTVGKTGRARDGIDQGLEMLREGSVVAVTLPTPEDGPPLEEDEEVARVAAAVAERLLARRAKAAHDDDGDARPLRPRDIGIAATHRAMNSAILRALPPDLRLHVRVDTPERWQGLERKVMVVVHPLSGVIHPSAFDLEVGRLCVMASRHRSGLVVVSRDHVRGTLETHIPRAEQAVGRPDVTGRGHQQHLTLWERLMDAGRVVPAG